MGKRMKFPWSPEVIGDQEMVGRGCPTYHEKVVTKVTKGVRTRSEGGAGVEPVVPTEGGSPLSWSVRAETLRLS